MASATASAVTGKWLVVNGLAGGGGALGNTAKSCRVKVGQAQVGERGWQADGQAEREHFVDFCLWPAFENELHQGPKGNFLAVHGIVRFRGGGQAIVDGVGGSQTGRSSKPRPDSRVFASTMRSTAGTTTRASTARKAATPSARTVR